MLSFDIETEGLDSRQHRITVASVYDPHRGISRTYNLVNTDDRDEIKSRRVLYPGWHTCLEV